MNYCMILLFETQAGSGGDGGSGSGSGISIDPVVANMIVTNACNVSYLSNTLNVATIFSFSFL
jgi:uncharacterized spore protein YtfJ